jgi:hypothetical protein
MLATNYLSCRCYSVPFGQHADETEKIVRLGLPRLIRLKENAPELDYSSFYVTTGTEHRLPWGYFNKGT